MVYAKVTYCSFPCIVVLTTFAETLFGKYITLQRLNTPEDLLDRLGYAEIEVHTGDVLWCIILILIYY